MRRDYGETKMTNSTNMFSKIQLPQHNPFSHHFHLSRDSQTTEDETNSRNSAPTTTITTSAAGIISTSGAAAGDGATIEVVRRPRGRPPGSKNKPKPPIFVSRELEPAMSPYILEVPGGNDVVETISSFCRRKSIGICVLTGSGTVANVTLRQPSATPGSTITFHGRFELLSISATFLPQSYTACPTLPSIFTISLAGPQGQIVGGSVVGPLVAAGTVFVIAATFTNPSYHRLPLHDEQRLSVSADGEGQQSPVGSSGGGAESGHAATGGEAPGMSMYGCHLPTVVGGVGDVIWAPTARPPPPY